MAATTRTSAKGVMPSVHKNPWIKGLGLRIQGSGFRVYGAWFRI